MLCMVRVKTRQTSRTCSVQKFKRFCNVPKLHFLSGKFALIVLILSLHAKCLSTHFVFIAQFTMHHHKTLTHDSKIVPNLNNIITTTSNCVENNIVFLIIRNTWIVKICLYALCIFADIFRSKLQLKNTCSTTRSDWQKTYQSLNSYNFWTKQNIVMKLARYVAWILFCEQCKFGGKNLYNSRYINFSLRYCFFVGAACSRSL